MRRTLPLLVALATGTAGLVLAAPATARTAPAAAAAERAHEAVPDQLLVGYVFGASDADKQRARGRAAAVREDDVVRGAADRAAVELVRLPRGRDRDRAAAELQADPAVAYAEPNFVVRHQAVSTDPLSTDPYFTDGRLWGVQSATPTATTTAASGAADAWAAGHVGSKAVYVGVIDEGIQFDHPDLAGQVWTNPYDPVNRKDDDGNGYVDDVRGWDFAANDATVYDGGTRGSLDDHGTHVAGTIGAKADGKGVVGVDHQVTMISGKFLGRSGGTTAGAVKAVDYFTDLKKRHGLNLVATNNSWGGGGYSQALFDAISRGNAQQILFVAAAGNSGTDNDATASYPSGYAVDNVVSVAAIDRTGGLASFRQFGATTVDLGAPGVGIWSTTAYNGFSSYNGTSMATPHVTGAVALYAAAKPGSSAATIRAALLGGVAATPALATTTVTGGRLHVPGMLTR